MVKIQKFFVDYERIFLLLLLSLAAGFFSLHATAPLYDYDEATYAKVTVDTLASGNIFDLTLSGHAWFLKPPLYIWLEMGAVKIFGTQEFAFRLPGIIASMMCLLLTYLITKELTKDVLSAGIAFLVLLFTPFFYQFAVEGQLDSSVLMCIMAIVYFWIRGQSAEKYFLWLFPITAVGFLFKSVIILLSAPILIIFSVCHWKWSWLKNKYLWIGGIISLFIIVPWHLLETVRFGMAFWNEYLGTQVFRRATSTITGTFSYGDYINALFRYGALWTWSLLASLAVYVGMCVRTRGQVRPIVYRHILAPLCTALFILVIFSIARTHLIPYILPIFPFIALFIGMLFHMLTPPQSFFPDVGLLLVSCLIVIGLCYFWTPDYAVPFWTTPDEATIGTLYRSAQAQAPAPLYSIGWQNLETLQYYSGTQINYRFPELTPQALIHGPLYAIMGIANLPIIFYKDANNTWKCKYGNAKILYKGPILMLVYSSGDYPQL